MKIAGIDPGYGKLGWSVFEKTGNSGKLISAGCFETSAKHSLTERIYEIFLFSKKLIEKHKPKEVAIEELYYFKNAKTVMGVGQARGAVISAFMHSKIPVFSYTPLQIKSSITGYGKADKTQVQSMLKRLVKGEIPLQDDASDACAVALTHIFSKKKLGLNRKANKV